MAEKTVLTEAQVSAILTCKICTLAEHFRCCSQCQFNIGTSEIYVKLLPAYTPSKEKA